MPKSLYLRVFTAFYRALDATPPWLGGAGNWASGPEVRSPDQPTPASPGNDGAWARTSARAGVRAGG